SHLAERAVEETTKQRLILLPGLQGHQTQAARLSRLLGVGELVAVEGAVWVIMRILELLGQRVPALGRKLRERLVLGLGGLLRRGNTHELLVAPGSLFG